MCVAPSIEYAWCQFKMTSSKYPYRSKHQVIILTVYIYIALKPCTSHKTKHGMLFNGTRIHIVPNSVYLQRFGGDLWWFAYIATRLAAANHHKPPPKRRKYLVCRIWNEGHSRKHRAPQTRLGYFEGAIAYTNYLLFTSTRITIIPNSGPGGGLRWFACFPLFSLPIVPNSGGDLVIFSLAGLNYLTPFHIF